MRPYAREIAWNGIVTMMAVHVVFAWNGLARPFLAIDAYVHGLVLKPYQFRVLPALIARVVLAGFARAHLPTHFDGHPPPFDSATTLAFIALQVPCAVWLVRSLRAWLSRRTDDAVGFWAAPGVLVVLPLSLYAYPGSNWYFPSDLPAVAFAFALLNLAALGRWSLFYPLFVVATLNRETTLLVTAALLFAGRSHVRGMPGHVAAQALLWTALKAALMYVYRSDPADGPFDLFVVQPALNVTYFAKPYWWPQVASAAAFLWIPCLALWRRHEDPHLRAMMATFPAYGVVMFLIGHLTEVRVFSEYVPVFYAALCLLAVRALRGPASGARAGAVAGAAHQAPQDVDVDRLRHDHEP